MGIIICPIIVGYVVLQRVVRSIKKDPSFSFLKLILRQRRRKDLKRSWAEISLHSKPQKTFRALCSVSRAANMSPCPKPQTDTF